MVAAENLLVWTTIFFLDVKVISVAQFVFVPAAVV